MKNLPEDGFVTSDGQRVTAIDLGGHQTNVKITGEVNSYTLYGFDEQGKLHHIIGHDGYIVYDKKNNRTDGSFELHLNLFITVTNVAIEKIRAETRAEHNTNKV